MTSLPPVFDGLDKAASELAAAAMRPGIHGKRDVLYSLDGGLVQVSRGVRMIAATLREAGYGPEVYDPVDIAATAIDVASAKAQDATHAVGSLMNMRVGELAVSGRQAPDHAELNGGN